MQRLFFAAPNDTRVDRHGRKNGASILQKDRSILGASGPSRARGIQLLADRRLDLLVRGNELLMPALAKVGS